MPSQTEIRDEVTAQIVQALEAEPPPWRRPWRATAGGSQPGRHSQHRLPEALPGREPAAARTPRPAPGTAVPLVGDLQPVARPRLPIRKRPPNVEEGHWGCRVVFWKPLDQDGRGRPDRRRRTRSGSSSSRPSPSSPPTRWRGRRRGSSRCMRTRSARSPARLPARRGADRGHRSRHPLRRRPCLLPPSRPGRLLPEPSAKATSSCCRPRRPSSPPGAFYETAVHELAHWSRGPDRLGPRQAGLRPGRAGGGDRLLLRRRRTRHPAGRRSGQPCRLPAELA